ELSEESQNRIQKNPLRVLDSKDEKDRKILESAPLLTDSLSTEAKERHLQVLASLDALGIQYQENPFLVRGLDYYDHTVFEYTTNQLGAQGAVLAGGRYDGLIGMMGGQPTPGCGWGAGLERLALMVGEAPKVDQSDWLAVVPVDDEGQKQALSWAYKLRQAGFKTEQPYTGNLSKKLKKAAKSGARWAIMIGGEELKNSQTVVKDLSLGEQDTVSLDSLISFLQEKSSHPL
ncbi:MAG: histidine--tRNA ligase, partial [Methylococcales bacterium]|nr:histidine--tRNA ligase [Methylococcales bacterium]